MIFFLFLAVVIRCEPHGSEEETGVESESVLYRFYMNYPEAADANEIQEIADVTAPGGPLDHYMECYRLGVYI